MRWEKDFESGGRERVYASDGSFVERDRKALPDVAFPEEFEDLIGVRRKREGCCGGGTVLLHDSFVIRHSDRIVLLDTADENLANPLHLVLHRQAEKGSKSWILDVLLEEERSGSKVGSKMVRSAPWIRRRTRNQGVQREDARNLLRDREGERQEDRRLFFRNRWVGVQPIQTYREIFPTCEIRCRCRT